MTNPPPRAIAVGVKRLPSRVQRRGIRDLELVDRDLLYELV
jgi:hypothetical protein